MSSPDLLPCPFCGCGSIKAYKHDTPGVDVSYIYCPTCKARSGAYEGTGCYAAWNIRHKDATAILPKDQVHA